MASATVRAEVWWVNDLADYRCTHKVLRQSSHLKVLYHL